MIVEDGTGKTNANAYCTAAFAADYHAARGNAAWDAVEDADAAIVRATDYLTQVYGQRWQGIRKTGTQALDWPRYDVVIDGYAVDSTVIPDAVKNACAELALRAAAGDLLPDVEAEVLSESVGPISVTYAPGARQSAEFRAVDRILAKYLRSGGSNIPMVRA
mgnify:FL=1